MMIQEELLSGIWEVFVSICMVDIRLGGRLFE